MFIPMKNGESIKYDKKVEFPRIMKGLTAYADNVELKEIWHMEIYRNCDVEKVYNMGKDIEIESIADLLYDHKPTKNEILWALGKYDVVYDGIIRITKSYVIE